MNGLAEWKAMSSEEMRLEDNGLQGPLTDVFNTSPQKSARVQTLDGQASVAL